MYVRVNCKSCCVDTERGSQGHSQTGNSTTSARVEGQSRDVYHLPGRILRRLLVHAEIKAMPSFTLPRLQAPASPSPRARTWRREAHLPYTNMAVGQNQWYHFGVGAPPILVYFSGDWDVHWGYDLDFDPWPYR